MYWKWMIVGCLFFQPMTVTADSIVDSKAIYNHDEMKLDLEQLVAKYKLESTVIGRSHFGKELYAVKVGTGKKHILLVGAHHGREWLTTTMLMKMLETYATSYQQQQKIGPFDLNILNQVSIWFVPMINPDGVDIQQGRIPMTLQEPLFRMNKLSGNWNRWKANGVGIDLNRQYPAGWRELKKLPGPHYQYYQGNQPLEASEVKALVAFTEKIDPLVAAAYHSSGQVIYWKYKNGWHTKRDKKIAEKLARATGYKLDKPPKKAMGGGFTDWFITTYHRPAYTIEMCPLVHETEPPLSTFEQEWQKNQLVGLILATEANTLPIKNILRR